MIPQVAHTSSSSGSGGSSSSAGTTGNPTVSQNMFLQLLIAQLKNQDPTSPSDSTQFVTQLAQFQTMEQSQNQGQDITAIRQDLDQIVQSLIKTNS